jgi:uncharacterized protein YndB with AHSA1/START domain
MSSSASYTPGPAAGAEVRRHGDRWTLVITRDLAHPPAIVWNALTDPAQLRAWAPYDADRNLGTPGTATLITVGAPTPHVTETRVTRAEVPTLLEFAWGGQEMRWELKPLGARGTRLTLWHNIDRNFIAMGAAGWHVCLDVLTHLLDDAPIGRLVGMDAMKFEGWQRLHAEYAKMFGVKATPESSTARSGG